MDKQTAVRFPESVKQRLRTVAYELNISINKITVQAVEKYLPELEKKCKEDK